jgi:hypothetical protein
MNGIRAAVKLMLKGGSGRIINADAVALLASERAGS